MTAIPLDQILANPDQPRKRFDPASLQELAASIASEGIIQPVVVEAALDENGAVASYILHDGERRCRAAKLAGLTEVPAMIVPGTNGDGAGRLVRALVANIQRQDLTPIEEARGFAALRARGLSVPQIAARLGTSSNQIYSRLVLLDLDPEIQEQIDQGAFPCSPLVAKAVLQIPDKAARLQLLAGSVARKSSNQAIIVAAEKLAAKLAERPQPQQSLPPAINGDYAPAVTLALAKSRFAGKPNGWDALAQVAQLPPWPGLAEAARATCRSCAWRSSASETICRDCPLPDAIAHMLAQASQAGSNGHR